MVQHRNILLSLSLVSLVFSTPLKAAEPIPLGRTPFSEVKQLFGMPLPGALSTGKVPKNELHFLQQHTDKKKITHIRMQQYYMGFPVFGGYAIMHGSGSTPAMWATKQLEPSMNGVVYKRLSADLGKPAPDYVEHGTEALEQYKLKYSGQKIMEAMVEPIIYVDNNHQAHWAYKVGVVIEHDEQIPEHPTAIIDAVTFETYMKWDDIKTARSHVTGRGFSGNRLVGLHQYGEDLPLLSITRNKETGICYMENPHVKVVNMLKHMIGNNQTMGFICSDDKQQNDGSFMTGFKGDGYDRTNGAFSPSNDALYIGTVIYDMYKKWYGVYPLEENGQAKKLIMRVHYGLRFSNAFWDGSQMTFGDGNSEWYPFVTLGIGAHEISHGFTQEYSNLIYRGQSGGLNESFSDMASKAVEFYVYGTNKWTIGEDIVKEMKELPALRFMDTPSRDGKSIDNVEDYKEKMNVHHSSGVYNRFFYLLSTSSGWDTRKAFEVMLTANMDYWLPTSTFDEAACGVLEAAKNLDYSLDDIKQAMDQVGIHYGECEDDQGANV